jgi:hypothetical protein
MLPSLKTTLFFGLLILIVVSVSDEKKTRIKREPNTFPNEDEGDIMVKLKKRVAKVGVELTPVGTGLSFQKAWHQVITVKLPSYDEYNNLLKSMTLDCNVYSKERYQEYDGYIRNKTRTQYTGTVADMYYLTLQQRCFEFQVAVRRTTNALLRDAFSSALPQTHNHEPISNNMSPYRRIQYQSTTPGPVLFNIYNDVEESSSEVPKEVNDDSNENLAESSGDLSSVHEKQVVSSTYFPENDSLSETNSDVMHETTTDKPSEKVTVINPIKIQQLTLQRMRSSQL